MVLLFAPSVGSRGGRKCRGDGLFRRTAFAPKCHRITSVSSYSDVHLVYFRTLFFIIFLLIPATALIARYREEFANREVFFVGIVSSTLEVSNRIQTVEKLREGENALRSQIREVDAVRHLKMDEALPEGLVPSQILHVAVMELKMADRTADTLQSNLPSAMYTGQESTTDASPKSRTEDSLLIKGRKRNGRSEVTWSRLPTQPNPTAVYEATIEIKSHIQTALKLLCKSHDLYACKPMNAYQGALLFHALGHDNATRLPRQKKRLTTGTSNSQASHQTARPDSTLASIPAPDFPETIQQLPFFHGLGETARHLGQSWTYDVLRVTRVTKDQAVVTAALLLASPIAEEFPQPFDWQRWSSFATAVQQAYGPSTSIPYHNRSHSAIHAHALTVLLGWLKHPEK